MIPAGAATWAMGAVTVVRVEDPGAERAFRELPYRLYHGDAFWPPPLRFEESRRWSKQHHASLRYRWSRRFLALRGGRVVGRVAAVIDDEFARRWGSGTGFFGFFECECDRTAACRLLDAAESALTLPDVNEVLRRVGGRLLPFGWLELARGAARIRSARVMILGVRPGFTGRGAAALLAYETGEALRRLGFKRAELSLVQGANERMRRVIEAFDCPKLKTFRLYGRRIEPRDGDRGDR